MPRLVEFVMGGPREQVKEEEANDARVRLEQIIAGVGNDEDVEYIIDIGCKQWRRNTLDILAPTIATISDKVVILKMDDVIAGIKDTDEGLDVYEYIATMFTPSRTTLRSIDISDNAMGTRALEKLKILLSSPNLRHLTMDNCGFSQETIPTFNASLQVTEGEGPGFARLHSLICNRNMIGLGGAQALSEYLRDCVDMRTFSYRGCRPLQGGTAALAGALLTVVETGNHQLENIDLMDCNLKSGEEEDHPIHVFGRVVANCPLLTRLGVEDCDDLNETGCSIIGQALVESKAKLVELIMGGGCLGPDGAAALVEALQANLKTLTKLSFPTAELEDDGVASIVQAFHGENNVLEELNLNENELTEAALDTLLDANFPNLRMLTLIDNADLDDDLDDKKQQLREKFPNATIIFDEEEVPPNDVPEDADAAVDALADQLAAGL